MFCHTFIDGLGATSFDGVLHLQQELAEQRNRTVARLPQKETYATSTNAEVKAAAAKV